MQINKAFAKRTRKGNVVKVVREHYLRDDIYCGVQGCSDCKNETPKLNATANAYVLLDTNVIIHQMDVVENLPAGTNVIVLQTVLQETKNLNMSTYNRLRTALGDAAKHFHLFSNEHHRETYVEQQPSESANDRNDRAIRVATEWYGKHLSRRDPAPQVVLITNDAGNKRKAIEAGLQCQTVLEYVKSLTDHPALLDLVARAGGDGDGEAVEEQEGDTRPGKRKCLYPEHLSPSEIAERVKAGNVYQGSLRMNPYNCFEGYLFAQDLDKDILIRGREDLNRAIDGDVVAVQLLPESQWRAPSDRLAVDNDEDEEEDEAAGEAGGEKEKAGGKEKGAAKPKAAAGAAKGKKDEQAEPIEGVGIAPSGEKQPTGRVLGVIKRNWRPYCGSIETDADGNPPRGEKVLFVAVDRKIPKIRIHTRQSSLLAGKRIVVSIDGWDRHSRYPSGHYVRIIGPIGDKAAETEVLLHENDIPVHPFSEDCMACLPKAPWRIENEDLSARKDLRGLRVCSIDPPGCKDIDDALHCRALPNGNFEVGVRILVAPHIADVSHFVKAGTALDVEGAARSTSVYLVGRRIDMLPEQLTTDICSLVGQRDRLTFSVVWELTPKADIVRVEFFKAVIKSVAALSYGEAQNRMDDPKDKSDLTQDIRNLNRLAKELKRKRIEAGALTLASPEVRFEIDLETSDPIDMALYETKEANSLVEEFMLLANCSVAEKIVQHFPQCSVLRRHPPPFPHAFDQLVAACRRRGIELKVSTSKELAESLDRAIIKDQPYFNKLVRILSTRCMNQAVYFSSGEVARENYVHYGLACPLYTHFTSPIRRYADVLVHRLLAACIGLESLADHLQNKETVGKACEVMNRRHLMAQRAGRASVQLHTLIFFRGKVVEDDAMVIRVRSNGVVVLVPKYGFEGIVNVNVKGAKRRQGADPKKGGPGLPEGPLFSYLDEEQALVSEGLALRLFERVRVRIAVESPQPHRQELVLRLAAAQS
eukprot:tig00000640_g2776.t1